MPTGILKESVLHAVQCPECPAGQTFEYIRRNTMHPPVRCQRHTRERNRRQSAESHAKPEIKARNKARQHAKSEPHREMLRARPCDICASPVGNHYITRGKDGVLRCPACQHERSKAYNREARRIRLQDPEQRARERRLDAVRMANPEYRARRNAQGNTPERRHKARARQYGLTPVELTAMYLLQGSKCWTCGAPENGTRLAIHHDHLCCNRSGSCGRCVVALLCRGCNLRAEAIERIFCGDIPFTRQKLVAVRYLFGPRWADLFGPVEARPRWLAVPADLAA